MSVSDSERLNRLRAAAVIPALVTPFCDEPEQPVDEPAFLRLAQRLIAEGADALLINGTTAESPTLSLAEKRQLLTLAAQARRESGREVPVISGVSGNSTHHAIEEAQALAPQADALLVVVPYYNKPTQSGLFAHFSAIAATVPDVPVILYNIPGRCMVNLEAATVTRLHACHDNIIGIKQSNPNFELLMELRAAIPVSSFTIWCGDDALTMPAVACGAVGTISVLANLSIAPMKTLITAVKAGDWNTAQQINAVFLGPAQGLFKLPNPTLVKGCLATLGQVQPSMRLPMVPVSAEEQGLVDSLLHGVQQLNQSSTPFDEKRSPAFMV